MKKLALLALLLCGCQSGPQAWTVAGSAYIESERPEGKAVAKLEVRYTPVTEGVLTRHSKRVDREGRTDSAVKDES